MSSRYHSRAEDVVKEWLTGYLVEENNRKIIKAPSGHWMELDLYLPEESFAVEVNGERYHEESNLTYNKWQVALRGRDPKKYVGLKKWAGYHSWKEDQCMSKGIKLIFVVAEDVIDFPEQTKAYIFKQLKLWQMEQQMKTQMLMEGRDV